MCLLAILHRCHPDGPLIAAANRDELLARPAVAMTVLRPRGPRILGGRDEVAGGTWLAVNEHGVVAGLTNRPSAGRDSSLRSRGELPLALAGHADARTAVEAFRASFRPRDFNPCWLLVGDRQNLYYLEMAEGDAPRVMPLEPGLHVLENRPLRAPSPKVDAVRAALAPAGGRTGGDLLKLLHDVLRSHEAPAGGASAGPDDSPPRPAERLSACVHAGEYGTRSSALIRVPPGEGLPALHYTDGPPCVAPLLEGTSFWRDAPG